MIFSDLDEKRLQASAPFLKSFQKSNSSFSFKGVRPPELIPENILQFYTQNLKKGKKASSLQQQFLAQVLLHELDESSQRLLNFGVEKNFDRMSSSQLFEEIYKVRHQLDLHKVYDHSPQQLRFSLKVRNHEEGECVTRLGEGRLLGFCAQGPNRELRNEDAYLVLPQQNFFMLCDGVSHNVAGHTASSILIDFMEYGLQRRHSLESSLLFAHAAFLQRIKNDASLGGHFSLASTLSCCQIEKNTAHFYHIGDTKILVLRNGHTLHESRDHSKGQELFFEKLVDLEEAHSLKHALSRCLGSDPILISRDLEHTKLELEKGDRILICSDGISHAFQDSHFDLTELKRLASETSLEDSLLQIYQQSLTKIKNACDEKNPHLKGQNLSLLLYQH